MNPNSIPYLLEGIAILMLVGLWAAVRREEWVIKKAEEYQRDIENAQEDFAALNDVTEENRPMLKLWTKNRNYYHEK